jgi:TPR repeat protein
MKWTRLITLSLATLLTVSSMASTFDDRLKSANQGDAREQYNLGVLYANGQGVPQDYKQAAKWYQKAAEQGIANAQYNLGYMYANGQGVPQDYKQAAKWYQKSAEQWFANAQYDLGVFYINGQGVPQDEKQAAKWYQKAAEQGFANAQYNLGVLYTNGQGVPQDYKQAVKWYQKSAEQGLVNAQYNLGVLYANGQGVPQDEKQAVKWYQKSAEQGFAAAQGNLGFMYANGQGVPQDEKQAVKWYQKSAEQGFAAAQGNLGFMYANGQGVKKDLKKALSLYKQSDTKWSRKKYVALEGRLNCNKTSQTKLFNVLLKCADRDTLMAATKNAGAVVKLEDKVKWDDKYLTASILKGSSELSISYTVDDFFAQAQYTFPSTMDVAQVSKVKSFVANKYGEPDYTNGDLSVGVVTYKWELKDGIELKVHRGWPNTTSYLTYTYPENNQNKIAEQQRQKEVLEAKQYKTQDNAF